MKKSRTWAAIGAALALLTAPAASALPVAGGTQDQPLRSDDLSINRVPDPFAVQAAQPVLPAKCTVTLITGERVRLDVGPGGRQDTTALSPVNSAGKPSGPATLIRFTWNGDAYAVPGEAVPFLSSTLDLRLFDVTYLVRAGLDDAHGSTLPVTVTAGTDGTATVPGVSATLTAGKAITTTMDRSQATRFGTQLNDQWRASRSGASTAPVGTLPGISRIELAARPGAPALPVPPAPATPGKVSPSLVPSGQSTPPHFRTVTLDMIDLEGGAGAGIGFVQNVDDIRLGVFALNWPGQPSPARVSVPEGTYSIAVTVVTPEPTDPAVNAAFVVKPQVEVRSDETITLDARDAEQYQVSLDKPVDAGYRQDLLAFTRSSVTGGEHRADASGFAGALEIVALHLYSFNGTPKIFATPTQPVTKGRFGFLGLTQWTPSETGVSTDPRYRFAFPHDGSIPSSMDHHVATADLTTVHEHVYQDSPGSRQVELAPMLYLPWSQDGMFADLGVPLGDRVDYWYSEAPDLTVWENEFDDGATRRWGPRRKIQPGQQIDETWGKGPLAPPPVAPWAQTPVVSIFGPATPVTDALLRNCAACRQDDNALVFLSAYGDSDPSHYATGSSGRDSSRVRFYRDGALALSSDGSDHGTFNASGLLLPLLPRAADYRLEWSETPKNDKAGRNDTVWSFRSGPGDSGAAPPADEQCPPDPNRACSMLPLLFVSYDLALDHQSRAAAGAPFRIGFTVSAQRGAPAPDGPAATVSVSYDDGKTWSAEQAAQPGPDGTFSTTITHPELAATSGFVSLRVRAHDSAGDAVDQTIIHAYGLTG